MASLFVLVSISQNINLLFPYLFEPIITGCYDLEIHHTSFQIAYEIIKIVFSSSATVYSVKEHQKDGMVSHPHTLCLHEIQRSQCSLCTPESNHFCIRRYPPSSFGSLSATRCPQKKQRKYKNYCTRCYVELFPDDDLSKLAHLASKELNCKKFLDSRFPGLFVHNRRLILTEKDKSAHNRRIDFQSSIKKTVLGLEVDEHQHKWGYDPKDEEKRIMQIYENADRNLVFIRFNPDKYKENGKWRRTPILKRYIALA